MVAEKILMEIDETLDQLIQNAEMIQGVDLKELSEIEIAAFQKTQESLVHHLLYMDQFLEDKKKTLSVQNKRSASFKIQEKLVRFEKLKGAYAKTVTEATRNKTPILCKRRSKRFLATG